jgi:TonB-linked SusC/RagA family outer membrane protein
MMYRLVRALYAGATLLALIASVSARAVAQSPTVLSGRVADESGAPISGATLTVDATSLNTQSNADGRYTLAIPGTRRGQATVTLRFIGYKMARQNVTLTGGPQTLDWALTAQATQLTGVVVTALSVQREKQTIGTSQQALGGEELTRVQTPSIVSAMSGKVSGVAINQSGNIGGSSRIVIRGQGSIRGENQPLFIVDGIPISNAGFSTATASGGRDYGTAISDLNADDIASMTVLKGPNAAAIYGSRASNGAVVITTKNGRNAPAGTKFNFTSRYTSDQLSIFPTYQNQYGQGFGGDFKYVDGAGGGVNDGGDESWGPKLNGQPIDQYSGKAQPWVAHPDNVRSFFQDGRSVSNNMNVVASGRGMGARLSITRDDVRGIVPNSSLGKTAASLSASGLVKEKLNVSGSLQYVQNTGNRPENGYTEGNPFMSFTWFGRQVDVAGLKDHYYNDATNPYGFSAGSLYNWNDNYHRNPYWQVYENAAPDSRERVIGQISTNYAFKPWLSGVFRAGGDSYRNSAEEHFAKGNIDRASASYNGGFTNATGRARETNFEAILTAQKSISFLDATLNVGGNKRRNDSYNNRFATNGILVPGIYNLANAGVAPTVTNSEFHSAVNSAYGSAVLTIKKVWTIEGTGRNDWSSTLPKENASYFYPSISSALVLTDLFPAITNSGWLTYAKLRGGIAQVGADAAPYQLQTLYRGSSNKFSGLALYSLSDTSANAALKPERTYGSEGGLELSFFNDRVTFDGTYYLKRTRDQIIPLTVAPATGFSSAIINAGQVSNRGIEGMVTIRPLQRPNGLQWSTTFNYTRNRNRVDSLAPGLTTIIIASQWGANIEARQGQPYGVIFGYGWQRDSASGKLLTTDGLPMQANAKSVLGNVNPDWVGGWANELRYKRVTLNTLLDVRKGGKNFSVGNWWGMYAGVLESSLRGREVDWNKPGLVVDGIDKATGKPNTTTVTAEDYGHNLYPVNEAGVFSTGFVKLREVRVSWDAPASIARRVRMSQLNLAFVGRNLYTWTNFPNYDPENSTSAGNGGQGFDMGAMPTTRNIGINLSITP